MKQKKCVLEGETGWGCMGRKKKEGIMRLLDLRKPQFVNEGLVSVVLVVPLILRPLQTHK
jgi:hypothetical protein